MKIKPAGHRVIVKPDKLDDVDNKMLSQHLRDSGFEIARENKQRQEGSVVTGVLIAVGSTAWKAFDDGEPWANVGDRVYFAKYGGYTIDEDGETYRLLNDEDITAVVTE